MADSTDGREKGLNLLGDGKYLSRNNLYDGSKSEPCKECGRMTTNEIQLCSNSCMHNWGNNHEREDKINRTQ